MERPGRSTRVIMLLALAAALGACADLPRRGNAACVVHAIVIEIPPFYFPPAGAGYAFEALPGAYDLDSARAACVQSVFERLAEVYAAQGNREPAVWEVAVYGPRGDVIESDTSSFRDGPSKDEDEEPKNP